MKTDRWRRIQRVYHEALTRNPGTRHAYVAESCRDDPELADEVLDLLSARNDAAPLVGDTLRNTAQEALESFDHHARVGQQVGHYRITDVIGEGGMAVVYRAIRDDDQFDQQVAVKILKKGMDSVQIIERFRNERQTLANLSHPNIARLFDGGTTEDDMPYLVMEAIDGQPIDQFCDDRQLSVSQRLNLVMRVSAAVHHAHQNLVVHRDLKPSNILVTDNGQPKLLDFGIAKILTDNTSTTHVTQTTQRFMTPDYAAPEQIVGQPITTGTDVYALGVLTFQLLTGSRPFERSTLSQHDLENAIVENDPPKPSDVANERIRRTLRGDLDHIILKALRKEPHRRYTTADQLADDLQRYLAGLPVLAHKDTFRYRATKYFRRNKVVVSAIAAVTLSLVVGIFAARSQAIRARTSEANATRLAAAESVAKKEAQQEALKARRTSDFLKRVLLSPDPYRYGKNYRILDLLQSASEWIDDETADLPEVASEIHLAMGIVYRGLGEYPDALDHLDKAHEIRMQVFGDSSLEVAEAEHELADLAYRERQYDRAGELFEKALRVREKHLDPDDLQLAATRQGLAGIHFTQKAFGKAEEMFRRVLERQGMRSEDPSGYARTINNLATTLRELGRYDEAEPLYDEALRVRLENHGPDHYNVAVSLANIATLRALQKRYDAAAEHYTSAVAIMETQLDPDHPTIAIVLHKFGNALVEAQRFNEALPVLHRAIDIEGKNFREPHAQTADIICLLAKAYDALGRTDEAIKQYETALSIRRDALGLDHADTQELMDLLANR